MLTNHVSLIGRFTKDAKITKGGSKKNEWKLARFTLACDDGINQEGEKLAQFISCKAWGTLATTIENYTAKGQLVAVEGKIVANNYEDDKGEMHYSYEVLVTGLQLLGKQNAPAEGEDEGEDEEAEEDEDEKPVNNKKYNRKGKK